MSVSKRPDIPEKYYLNEDIWLKIINFGLEFKDIVNATSISKNYYYIFTNGVIWKLQHKLYFGGI